VNSFATPQNVRPLLAVPRRKLLLIPLARNDRVAHRSLRIARSAIGALLKKAHRVSGGFLLNHERFSGAL
jgi:hypothetical protein